MGIKKINKERERAKKQKSKKRGRKVNQIGEDKELEKISKMINEVETTKVIIHKYESKRNHRNIKDMEKEIISRTRNEE